MTTFWCMYHGIMPNIHKILDDSKTQVLWSKISYNARHYSHLTAKHLGSENWRISRHIRCFCFRIRIQVKMRQKLCLSWRKWGHHPDDSHSPITPSTQTSLRFHKPQCSHVFDTCTMKIGNATKCMYMPSPFHPVHILLRVLCRDRTEAAASERALSFCLCPTLFHAYSCTTIPLSTSLTYTLSKILNLHPLNPEP